MTDLAVSVLGPVRVCRDGTEVDLGTQRHRQVVAALALAGGEPVPSSLLIERIWGPQPAASALATLHGYVAALRRILEPDRPPRTPPTTLVTNGDAYVLAFSDRDDLRFESSIRSARARLDVVGDHLRPRAAPQDREAVELALDELDEAQALWRGTPYAELGDDPVATLRRARLEDLRRGASELSVVAHLALGRHDVVRGELEARTTESALHERWWALRAVALARESRQADALAVLDELRDRLADELGVDPSPPLQELRTAILRQEPSVTDAPTRSAAPTPVRQARVGVRTSPWQIIGRHTDLGELRTALDRARDGHAELAVLSGPAGIGKSRLVEELALEAGGRGWQVTVGQCTQDAGTPPLWPWLSILAALGTPFDLPEAGLDGGGAFRVRADLVERVREAAARRPLLLVMEDLHWADPSTLAVLRLLIQTVDSDALLLVGTWRSPAEPAADLSAVAEAFARRHAVRLELSGLDQHAEQALFQAISGRELSAPRAAELHQRTEGNPFFVVEFARLAAGDETLDRLLAAGELPSSVSDVLGRRLDAVPERTRSVLRTAAVLGHSFDLETLGDVTRTEPDELLDVIEPALTVGLLAEEQAEVLRFGHALVADVLLASMSTTRRARTHQLVAEILEQRPGREAEVARHWQGAGPRHVDRAWRALAAAARAASSMYAYVDATELLGSALALQADDGRADPDDRLDLLQQAQDAARWAAMRPELIDLVEQSVAVATGAGDVARAAEAATVPSSMIWRSAPDGEVNDVVVGALRRALDTLPDRERALRCRVMTALAIELYDDLGLPERTRLCDEAVARAREIGDPALLGDILFQAVMATWAPSTAGFRLAAAEETVALARDAGRRYALAMALTLLTNVYSDLGRPAEMRATAAAAREAARELKVVYAELALDVFELGWAAAAGRSSTCQEILAAARGHLTLLGLAGGDTGDGGLPFGAFDLYALRLWQGQAAELVPDLRAAAPAGSPMHLLTALALLRTGRREEASAHLDAVDLPAVLTHEDELSVPLWCAAAELAASFGDAEVAARVHARLAPYAGRSSGGDGYVLGPVDAFLALAAHGAGRPDAARAHADRALELIDDWDLPPVREWFERLRGDAGC